MDSTLAVRQATFITTCASDWSHFYMQYQRCALRQFCRSGRVWTPIWIPGRIPLRDETGDAVAAIETIKAPGDFRETASSVRLAARLGGYYNSESAGLLSLITLIG